MEGREHTTFQSKYYKYSPSSLCSSSSLFPFPFSIVIFSSSPFVRVIEEPLCSHGWSHWRNCCNHFKSLPDRSQTLQSLELWWYPDNFFTFLLFICLQFYIHCFRYVWFFKFFKAIILSHFVDIDPRFLKIIIPITFSICFSRSLWLHSIVTLIWSLKVV